jgi:hypothetical protein
VSDGQGLERTPDPAGRVGRVRLPSVVRLLCFAFVLLIPIRILGLGFRPGDDALRHAAKAASHKAWGEILVQRSDVSVSSHPGWEALLTAVQRASSWSAPTLVVLSVVGLFVAVNLPALVLLRRPEAWLLSLLVFAVMDFPALTRLVLGRPFLWNDATLLLVCWSLPALSRPRVAPALLAGLAALLGLATWVHPAWYLFLLPVAACLLAREWRAAARLLGCLVVGVLAGGLLSGHPVAYLWQSLLRGVLATGLGADAQDTLVFELRPRTGLPYAEAALLAALAWRTLRRGWSRSLVDNPLFLLVALGWALSFHSLRFWTDWAVPPALLWLALELEDGLTQWLAEHDPRRFALAGAAGLAALLALTAESRGLWGRADRGFGPLLRAEAIVHLPDPGGILYSREMGVFFELFFRYPDAPWRYMLGYEPGILPPEDLETYRTIVRSGDRPEAYAPWVRKMRAQDRLILRTRGPADPPRIPGLEWQWVGLALWSGRLPAAVPPQLPGVRPPQPR